MLYTKKGDNGKSIIRGKILRKDNKIFEILGNLDEVNSFIGYCRAKSKNENLTFKNGKKINLNQLLLNIQEKFFIIQAQIAGSNKKIEKEDIQQVEKIIDECEKEIPSLKSFVISGENELSSLFDLARALIRKLERKSAKFLNKEIDKTSFSFINRLSSLFFVIARKINQQKKIKEKSPSYK